VRIGVFRLLEKHFCGPSPDCEERKISSSDEWGVLKTTAITWDGWNETAHKVLPRKYWGRNELKIKKGDVLITKAGPRDRVAVVVHVTSEPHNLIVSGKMIGLRPRLDAVLPQVLAGTLSLRESQEYIHARTTGMAESQVNFANNVLLDAEIDIPLLPEQIRIAAVLDTVDDAVMKKKAVIEKVKMVRAGMVNDLLTRGIDEHGQLRDPVTHPEQFKDSPLGRIPSNWKVQRIGEVLQQPPRNGYSPQEASSFRGSYMLGLSCLTMDGFAPIQLKNAPVGDKRLSSFLLRDGDLVISRSNTKELVALPGIFRHVGSPCYYPDLMMRLYPKPDLNKEFFELLLRYSRSRESLVSTASGTSSSMVKITGSGVMETFICYPDLSEQQEILAFSSQIKKYLRALQDEQRKLSDLKSGLRTDLLTGRVPTPETLTTEGAL
jgi:type I restriction enzyme, S subunit